MNVHATIDLKWASLAHPNGSPIRLNNQDFVAIDRDRSASYEATYRPQALYNRANEGFHVNNESFLLHEVATNLQQVDLCPRLYINAFFEVLVDEGSERSFLE